MRRRFGLARLFVVALLLGAQMLLLASVAAGAQITSSGPLTQVIVTPDLGCQVAHVGDDQYELYGGDFGSCGTFLSLGGTLYGPSGVVNQVPFAPVSQSPVTGTGTAADPFRIVTVVDAPGAGVRIQQVDSYVVGAQDYRTDVEVLNAGPSPVSGIIYRAGDCYLQNEDTGLGRVDNSGPACIVEPSKGQRIEQWTALTPGSHYFEGYYGDVWDQIGQQIEFPDRCDCTTLQDNGAGLSWPITVAPNQTVTFSQGTYYSPTGRGPLTVSFGSSVPDPTQITLDPVVVVESVAVTAGVILLVPFPSALFNSTLEDNYDEVMSGVDRLRRRLRALWLALVARVRAELASRRARPQTPEPAFSSQVDASARVTDPNGQTPAEHFAMSALGGEPPPTVFAGPELSPRATAMIEPCVPGRHMLTPMPSTEVAARDVWRTPVGIVGFIVISALLYSFLDPTFGLTVQSLATLLGLALGLLVILVAYGTPLLLFSRNHRIGLTVRALPATLVVAVICILVSRLSSFQPGYLYGLVIGFFFAHGVTHEIEGKAEAAAAGTSLVAALLAWILLAFLRAGAASDPFTSGLLQSATVTVVVAGLENAVFAMLPLRFLPGAAVYSWNRIVWLVLIGLGIFGFAHVLLNPSAGAGYLADTTRTSFFTLIVLLAAFAVVSVAFWGWFRFRAQRPHVGGPGL